MDIAVTEPSLRMPLTRILRLREVCHATGLGRSMIYRLQQENRFPHSVKLTDYAVGWLEAEVQTWLATRAAQRDVGEHTALLGSFCRVESRRRQTGVESD